MTAQKDEQLTKRMEARHRLVIKSAPGSIFPLLCPVREEEWIDGWTRDSYRLVHSQSGFNEKYCVFQEDFLKPFLFGIQGPTTWVTTQYEAEQYALEFTLIFGDLALLNRAFSLQPLQDGATACQWIDTVTFLTGGLKATERERFESKLGAFSHFLGQMLKHYCERGEVLKVPSLLSNESEGALPGAVKSHIQDLVSGS